MPQDAELTESEEGKRVITEDGEEIGRITEVHHNAAAVKPDRGLTDQLRSALGWGDTDKETYRLQAGDVSRVTDETVVVHGDLGE